jgi:hypothetical protein
MAGGPWADGRDGRSFYIRFLFASMYIRVAQHLGPTLGVDFEKPNSLVFQDSLRRLHPSHFLDFIGPRLRG